MEIIRIDQCPTCGHKEFTDPFPQTLIYDNSLGDIIRKGQGKKYPDLDISQFARNEWRVCNYCSLIFCVKRTSVEDANHWYNKLFAEVELREYDRNPLPKLYLKNQKIFAEELFHILDQHQVFNNVQSVIHFRCNAGLLLHEIAQKTPIRELYGLEYFENPALHAAKLLGKDFIARMNGPEPKNPFGRQKFDLILLEHGLTHAYNPTNFLNYIKSLLNPNGKIVIFNEPDHARGLRSKSYYRRGINFFHKQLFAKNSMSSFLRYQGLECMQLPHPVGRRWAVSSNSMLFICKIGESHPIPQEDSKNTVILLQSWLKMHAQYTRYPILQAIKKPIKRFRERFLGATKRTFD